MNTQQNKTSHELAYDLLACPDLPICLRDMAAPSMEESFKRPAVYLLTGFTEDGESGEHLEIHVEGECTDGEKMPAPDMKISRKVCFTP